MTWLNSEYNFQNYLLKKGMLCTVYGTMYNTHMFGFALKNELHVCIHESMHACVCECVIPHVYICAGYFRDWRRCQNPWAWRIDDCEPRYMATGNQTPDLWKNSKCS